MRITRIELFDFRNYGRLDFSPSEGINVLFGDNAQGKTNVLEAVYLCCLGKSHRAARDSEMIRQGYGAARVRISLMRRDGPRVMEMRLFASAKKQALIDGVPIARLSELLGHMNCALFSPEDVGLIKDGPSIRRRFMDTTLCQLYPAYYGALWGYNRALLQRNLLLKRGGDARVYDAFESSMAQNGARVAGHRRAFIEALSVSAAAMHSKIGGSERLDISYAGALLDTCQSEAAGAFKERLARGRAEDIRRGTSLYGPHRDELSIKIDGKDSRLFASQGQQRTAALSIKLAAAGIMREQTGEQPVIMLDDVFSELDQKRQKAILDLPLGQALITTAERPHLENASVFRVENAGIRPI